SPRPSAVQMLLRPPKSPWDFGALSIGRNLRLAPAPGADEGLLRAPANVPGGVDGQVRIGDLDPRRVERVLQLSQELALHVPLLERGHLQAGTQHDRRVLPALDPGDLQVLADAPREGAVGAQPARHLPTALARPGDIRAVGDAGVDHRVRVFARQVRHRGDRPVGDEMDVTVVVAHAHVAQGHLLHQPRLAYGLDYVALADLVLDQQNHAREIVLHQALQSEADRN